MKNVKKIVTVLLAALICFGLSSPLIFALTESETTPEITKLYCVSGGIKITWNKIHEAKSYTVYRWCDGAVECEKIKTLDKNKSSYSDRGLVSGTKYHYTVAAETGKKTVFSRIASFTYLSAPEKVSAKMTSKGIYIKWSRVKGATGYNIYRKTGDGEFKKICALTGTKKLSCTDKKAKNCVKYTYTVRAVNGSSKSAYALAQPSAVRIKTPVLVSAKNSPDGVTVKWKKSTAPDSYEIYRKAGGEWKKAGTVSSRKTTFIDKKASYGKNCTYKVRAVCGGEKGYCSSKKSVRALDPKKPAIALTFDDGPYSPVTNQILDSLEKYGGKATFFVVGSRVETYKDCVKREAALGCEVGCHTFNHAILTRLSPSEINKEISSAVKITEKYSGKKIRVVRAPGGAVNSTVRKSVKYPLVNWSVDTLDWQHRTTEITVSNVKKYAKDGAIVLMHDLYFPTGNAAVELIPWLTGKGYQLVTVSELFELKGINATKGNLYTHG